MSEVFHCCRRVLSALPLNALHSKQKHQGLSLSVEPYTGIVLRPERCAVSALQDRGKQHRHA